MKKMAGAVKLLIGLLQAASLCLLPACRPSSVTFDILIRDGMVVDGTGNPWFRADIGVRGNRIASVGDLTGRQARKEINASGAFVAPGFIDIHTHCDRDILEIPTVDNYVTQGVTSVIGGNCGGHPFPLDEFFENVGRRGVAVNLGVLAGHNTIREKVMGYSMAPPSQEDMKRMKFLLEGEMKAGALGLSTGLAYLPGIYSSTEEIVELASVAARYGGFYATHMRDQGKNITQAVEEAVKIGEANGMPVQISHIKLANDAVWNEVERVTRPVEEARRRGVEVALDLYPYTATSSGFTSSFPSWAFEGGRERFRERLKDGESYRLIREEVIERRLTSARNIDKLETIQIASCRAYPEYEGKNVKDILLQLGRPPTVESAADFIIDLERNGGASGVFFQMDETDVESFMRLPYVMIGSDGEIQVVGKGVPHPRNYGTFPRVLGRYVREKGVLSLEEAVRKMTSFPAQVLRLNDRGILKAGMMADIVVFAPLQIRDVSTFAEPHAYSQGVRLVVVNGGVVLEEGNLTGELPGMILYGQGRGKAKG